MSGLWETVSKTEVHTDGVWPCLKELYKSGEPSGEPCCLTADFATAASTQKKAGGRLPHVGRGREGLSWLQLRLVKSRGMGLSR